MGGAQAPSWVTFPSQEVAGVDAGKSHGDSPCPELLSGFSLPLHVAGQASTAGPVRHGMGSGQGRWIGAQLGLSQFCTFSLQSKLMDSDYKS